MRFSFLLFVFAGCIYSTISTAQTGREREDSIRTSDELSRMIARRQVDSLSRLIASSPKDTLKITRLNLLTNMFSIFSYDTAFQYAMEAKALSDSLEYWPGKYGAVRNLGTITEAAQNNWITAIAYYKEAIDIAEKNNMYREIHEGYTIILNSYFYVGDFPAAMDIATKGLNSANREKDNSRILLYNNLIGTIYLKQENYTEALRYYSFSLQLADRMQDDTERCFVYLGLGDVYIAQQDSAQAFSYLFRSLDIARKLFDKVSHRYRHKIAFILYRIGYAYKVF